jgi:RecA-family ATPase
MIFGPPGCGKGILSVHLLVHLAAGIPLFGEWRPEGRFRTMLVSAEDDRPVLRHRLWDLLSDPPEGGWGEMDFKAFPLKGATALTEIENRTVVPTERYTWFRNLLAEHRPDLVMLDTLTRFLGGDENSNPMMTRSCELLEALMDEFGCNIILVHHTNKGAGDVVHFKSKLAEVLSQSSLRGATALAGAIRWAMMLAPMSTALARKLTGRTDLDEPDGNYVAAQVVKKNAGPRERMIVLSKSGGSLERIHARKDEELDRQTDEDAAYLAREVNNRIATNEPPLTPSSLVKTMNWGRRRADAALAAALGDGRITLIRHGRGQTLVPGGEDG